MKTAILTALLLIAGNAAAQSYTAYYTGRSEQVQSVTYEWVWNCEYQYAGRTFWRAFRGNCPNQIEI